MHCSWFQALPALFAAFLLCVLPSCASMPDGLFDAAYAQAREDAREPINFDLKPVVEGAPTCIDRGAGMEFDPPNIHGDDGWAFLALAVVYLIIYIGYGFGWCCVKLGELIYDAFEGDSDECEECESEPEESSESQSP